MKNKKMLIITTVPQSLFFFKNQITFLKRSFEIQLVSSPGEKGNEIAQSENVLLHNILMKREISLLNDLKSLLALIKLFLKEKPFIIHANTPKASLLALIAGKMTAVPRRIYYVHGLRYEGVTGLKRHLLMLMEKISCTCATDIIAVSQGVRKTMLSEITKKNISVIYNGSVNGINLEYFNPDNAKRLELRKQLNIDEDDFVFGFVGRLVGDKGINELVEAFQKMALSYKKCKLLLIGNFENDLDPLKTSTLDLIKNHTDIKYVGFQKDIRPYLSQMDVFVFPSYREGFGISLMEAAAMNVPAISSNISGCNEIIEEHVNGYLISVKDTIELHERMLFVYKNRDVLASLKINTRQIIANKYDQQLVWEAALKKYLEIAFD